MLVLRIFMFVAVQTYYVAMMSLLLVSADCQLAGTVSVAGGRHDTLGDYANISECIAEGWYWRLARS